MNLVEANAGKYKWRINLDVLEQTFPTELAIFPKMDTETYTGPTLFIGGGNSDHIPLEDHNGIKKLFPLAEFDYINGASHWVHVDKPHEFVDLLTNFINR
jgi:abhydrolase domain-containing protein 11